MTGLGLVLKAYFFLYFGCTGHCCGAQAFFVAVNGGYSSFAAWDPQCCGFSCCGVWTLGCTGFSSWHTSLVVPQRVGSSQCVFVLSCVQLFAALWTVACQAPLSIGFPGILEWVASFYSRGCYCPRDWTHLSCIGRQILYQLCHQGRWSSQTRDQTGVPCIARQILNHWIIREAPEIDL